MTPVCLGCLTNTALWQIVFLRLINILSYLQGRVQSLEYRCPAGHRFARRLDDINDSCYMLRFELAVVSIWCRFGLVWPGGGGHLGGESSRCRLAVWQQSHQRGEKIKSVSSHSLSLFVRLTTSLWSRISAEHSIQFLLLVLFCYFLFTVLWTFTLGLREHIHTVCRPHKIIIIVWLFLE